MSMMATALRTRYTSTDGHKENLYILWVYGHFYLVYLNLRGGYEIEMAVCPLEKAQQRWYKKCWTAVSATIKAISASNIAQTCIEFMKNTKYSTVVVKNHRHHKHALSCIVEAEASSKWLVGEHRKQIDFIILSTLRNNPKCAWRNKTKKCNVISAKQAFQQSSPFKKQWVCN